ncbi:MAG: hypothetical protein L0H75_02595, partial [Nitrosospira sp.]|nr:hypothetical protein [Nitrosospira sp.]
LLEIGMETYGVNLPSQSGYEGSQCVCLHFKHLGIRGVIDIGRRRGHHGFVSLNANETQSYLNHGGL